MAQSDDSQRPIVIKRKKAVRHRAHGGAWKIAYADFVTAMMAFFLLMWLLGSTAKGDLDGIAEYFSNPLKVSLRGGPGSGSSSSIIDGGGTDLTRTNGQVKRGDVVAPKRTISLKAAQAEMERLEVGRLIKLRTNLEDTIDETPALRKFKDQLLIDISSQGLRIQIVDEKSRPMFESGSAQLLPHTKMILRSVGSVLNDVPNRISLAGHTDATQYLYGERAYSNWELSADRSNASRRELVAGGLETGKVIRIVGLASSVLFNAKDPYDPINRRISIIVLNKRTEEGILRDGALPSVDVASTGELTADGLQPGKDNSPVSAQLADEPIPAPTSVSEDN